MELKNNVPENFVPIQHKKKIDLAFLLEKYGPKRTKPKKPLQPKPKYYDKGFSVKFKLSHAYKGLERQEHDVLEPLLIQPKPKLSNRQLRRLKAKPENDCVMSHNCLTEHVDKLSEDLQRYAEIGKLKRHKSDLAIHKALAVQKQPYLGNDDYEEMEKIATIERKVPLSFWKSLSNRNGTEKENKNLMKDYKNKTVVTDIMVNTILKKPKIKPATRKKVTVAMFNNTVGDSKPENQTASTGIDGSKAVAEWQRRKQHRQLLQKQHSHKIQQAQQKTKLNNKHSTRTHKRRKHYLTTSMLEKRIESKSHPDKAVDTFNLNDPKQVKSMQDLTIKSFVPLSSWSKSLHCTYLDVPDTFEDINIERLKAMRRKVERENDSSADSKLISEDEEEVDRFDYKPTTYLYGMCHCQSVAKKGTLEKLQKSKRVSQLLFIDSHN